MNRGVEIFEMVMDIIKKLFYSIFHLFDKNDEYPNVSDFTVELGY